MLRGLDFIEKVMETPRRVSKRGNIMTRLEINNDHSGSTMEARWQMVYPGRVFGCVKN